MPGLFERLEVAPQALSRERSHVVVRARRDAARRSRSTASTSASTPGEAPLSAADVEAQRRTLENVGLWDSRVLRPAINEAQAIGGYYGFAGTTVDRYGARLMTVAARRLDLTHLPPESRTWANTHFAYTHGYGVVAVHAGQTDAGRYPRFAQREFGRGPLGLTEPRIYFGERAPLDPPYVVVNSGRGEVEQPEPGLGAARLPLRRRRRDRARGPRPARRVRGALRGPRAGRSPRRSPAASRILIHRDPRERLRLLAPFLDWDGKPQTVVAGGRVQSAFYGYTTSAQLPVRGVRRRSAIERVNYVRASVLAVVDAFDGRVTLYAADAGDPLLRAWSGVYPGLFTPLARLPARVARRTCATRAGCSTPRRSSTAPTTPTTRPGSGTARTRGSRRASWRARSSTRARSTSPIPATRRSRRPPRCWRRFRAIASERFMLTAAFTPRGRENLVAYLAGSVDASGRRG